MSRFQTIFEELISVEGLILALAALLAIMVHESCHGFAAYKLGDRTAKEMGRISLNPVRHIDPFGLIMLIVFGFGWAKPVPVDSRYFKKPKRDMAITAAAGPLSNFILALLSLIAFNLCRIAYQGGTGFVYWLATFFQYCAYINIGLGVFNLFPIPPLDGSKIFGAALPDRAYYTLMRYERYGMFLLMVVLLTGFLDTPLMAMRDGIFSGLSWVAGLLTGFGG